MNKAYKAIASILLLILLTVSSFAVSYSVSYTNNSDYLENNTFEYDFNGFTSDSYPYIDVYKDGKAIDYTDITAPSASGSLVYGDDGIYNFVFNLSNGTNLTLYNITYEFIGYKTNNFQVDFPANGSTIYTNSFDYYILANFNDSYIDVYKDGVFFDYDEIKRFEEDGSFEYGTDGTYTFIFNLTNNYQSKLYNFTYYFVNERASSFDVDFPEKTNVYFNEFDFNITGIFNTTNISVYKNNSFLENITISDPNTNGTINYSEDGNYSFVFTLKNPVLEQNYNFTYNFNLNSRPQFVVDFPANGSVITTNKFDYLIVGIYDATNISVYKNNSKVDDVLIQDREIYGTLNYSEDGIYNFIFNLSNGTYSEFYNYTYSFESNVSPITSNLSIANTVYTDEDFDITFNIEDEDIAAFKLNITQNGIEIYTDTKMTNGGLESVTIPGISKGTYNISITGIDHNSNYELVNENNTLLFSVIDRPSTNNNNNNNNDNTGNTGGTQISNWECGNWSECIDGTQTRTCTDIWGFNQEYNKPDEEQSCTVVIQNNPPELVNDSIESEPVASVGNNGSVSVSSSNESTNETTVGLGGFITANIPGLIGSILALLIVLGIIVFAANFKKKK